MKLEEQRKAFSRQLGKLRSAKGVVGIDGDVILLGRSGSGQNTWFVLETHDISKNHKQFKAAVRKYQRWLEAWNAKQPRKQST